MNAAFVAGWLARERGWGTREWFLRPTLRLRAAAAGVFAAVAVALSFSTKHRPSLDLGRAAA